MAGRLVGIANTTVAFRQFSRPPFPPPLSRAAECCVRRYVDDRVAGGFQGVRLQMAVEWSFALLWPPRNWRGAVCHFVLLYSRVQYVFACFRATQVRLRGCSGCFGAGGFISLAAAMNQPAHCFWLGHVPQSGKDHEHDHLSLGGLVGPRLPR